MNAFFDTSVLVPVFYGDHVHHQASLDLFIQFNPIRQSNWLLRSA
jgi:predicted nucleic acid-binding protein